jgi:biotin operon repressor
MRTRKPRVLTDEKVIELFLSSPKTYISGEAIGKHFGVSRVAIWQRLVVFRKEGFELSGETNKGYTISATPELPYLPLITVLLNKLGSPGIAIGDSEGCLVTDFALSKHFSEGFSEFAAFAVPQKSCFLSLRNTTVCPPESIVVTYFRQITANLGDRHGDIEPPIREATKALFSEFSDTVIEFDYLVGASGILGISITVVLDHWRRRAKNLGTLENYPFRSCPSLLVAAALGAIHKTLRRTRH